MIRVEMTDTFGGESNYAWVIRSEDTQSKDLKQALRKFKRDQGIKVKHKVTCETGDMRAIDLRGACVRIMAWYEY
jgi:hypothetical protein